MNASTCKTCRGLGYVVMAPQTTWAGGERVDCPTCIGFFTGVTVTVSGVTVSAVKPSAERVIIEGVDVGSEQEVAADLARKLS